MVFYSKKVYLEIFLIFFGFMLHQLHAGYVPCYEPKKFNYKSLLVLAHIMELISKRHPSSSECKEIVAFLQHEPKKKKFSVLPDSNREISFLSDHDIDGLIAVRKLLNDPIIQEYPEEINEILKKCFYVEKEINNIVSKRSFYNFFEELANCLFTAMEEVQKEEMLVKKSTASHTINGQGNCINLRKT
ncbi:hypothetical protein EKK58_06280 [Candidatus Dependentiae bacterium]|nr:MAG: hypothetical protein EKK58_06280 [Candidatus Dependentiae bacterium]